jgi:hypothetical protein
MQHRDVTVADQSLNAIIALLSSMMASRSLWGIHQHCRNHTLVSPCHIPSGADIMHLLLTETTGV